MNDVTVIPHAAFQVPMINACERCSRIVKKWKYHQKFQRIKLNCVSNPLVLKYENLLKRDEMIVEAMLKYEACVFEADPPKKTKKQPNEPENILAMRLGVTILEGYIPSNQY